MAWTSAANLQAQTQKLWDKGVLLADMVQSSSLETAFDSPTFPRQLRLQSPTTAELSSQFDAVRVWAQALRTGAGLYRLVERETRSPVLGSNRIPNEAWLDTASSAFKFIGKTRDAAHFAEIVQHTRLHLPLLLPWLQKRPHTALELQKVWPLLLKVVAWVQAHPRSGVYLRQVDIAGIDSKLIESHRSVLAELLDLALAAQPEAIDPTASGFHGFCQRYGFLDKPLRVRLRWLDAASITSHGSDITLTQAAFAQLNNPAVSEVFITENEVNFLAFPPVANALVIFGGGFGGLERLCGIAWLHQRRVYYWGDIDTHGFAMLNQLRAYLPHVQSLMMDKATLLLHADHWGHEPQPHQRDLPRLTAAERDVYNSLRDNQIQPGLRLEQERIGFGWVQQALAALRPAPVEMQTGLKML